MLIIMFSQIDGGEEIAQFIVRIESRLRALTRNLMSWEEAASAAWLSPDFRLARTSIAMRSR